MSHRFQDFKRSTIRQRGRSPRNFGYAVFYKNKISDKERMHPVVETTYANAEKIARMLEKDPSRPFGRDPRFEYRIVPLTETEYEEWVEATQFGKRSLGSGWSEAPSVLRADRRVVE